MTTDNPLTPAEERYIRETIRALSPVTDTRTASASFAADRRDADYRDSAAHIEAEQDAQGSEAGVESSKHLVSELRRKGQRLASATRAMLMHHNLGSQHPIDFQRVKMALEEYDTAVDNILEAHRKSAH